MRPAPTFRSHLLTTIASIAAVTVAVAMSGCTSADVADDGSAALVPSNPAALEAYLKTGLELSFDDNQRWVTLDLTAAPPGTPETPFSTTTLQTEGVDEADLVKFDGQTLFVARQAEYHYPDPTPMPLPLEGDPAQAASTVFFPTAPSIDPAHVALYAATDDPAHAEEMAQVPLPNATNIHGMMLLPESQAGPALLIVIGSSASASQPGLIRPMDSFGWWSPGRVQLWIFDVSDPVAPRAVHRSKVEGRLVAVRRLGDQLVLVTGYSPYLSLHRELPLPFIGRPDLTPTTTSTSDRVDELAELDVEDLLPRRWIELPEGDGEPTLLVKPDDCFVPKQRADADAGLYYDPNLVTISIFDLRAPEEPQSVCAAGPVARIYSSTRALYLAATSWGAESQTVVHKFAYTERGAAFRGSGQAAGVPGGSNRDFGLGEIGDAFGIMTMVTHAETFERTNRLTLLAEAADGRRRLEERSHLPNEREPDPIGKPGEQLYAVRFLGDRVYAVTFRRIDPLYVIDVEDSHAPFIAGELEIPGFSDSLHPITADLLVGIGKDSIEDGGTDWFQGVKVELFDVSDPSEPVSVDSLIVGRRGSETGARHSHHAFTSLDLGDGTSRIAIPIDVAEGPEGSLPPESPSTWFPWSHTGLHLFEVDHDAPALHTAGEIIVAEAGEEGGVRNSWTDRSRLQGDAVHYVHDEAVWSADWSAPEAAVGPN